MARDTLGSIDRVIESKWTRRLFFVLTPVCATLWAWSQNVATKGYVDAKVAAAVEAHAEFEAQADLAEAYRETSSDRIDENREYVRATLRAQVRLIAAESERRPKRRAQTAARAAERFDRLVREGVDMREAARRALETSPY